MNSKWDKIIFDTFSVLVGLTAICLSIYYVIDLFNIIVLPYLKNLL